MDFELKLPETVCLRCGAPIMSVGEDSFIACEHCGTVMEVTRFTKEEKRLVQAMEEMHAAVEQAKKENDEAMKLLMQTGEESAAQAKEDAAQRYHALQSRLDRMQSDYMSTHEKQLNGWYSWGEKAQRAGRYAEAISHYQKVLAGCHGEAELYWRIVLCRYGVEYVKDYANNIFIPTLTRMQVDSILNDADYESAIKCARSPEVRSYYEAQAEHLERILRQYQYICGSETPYDVFISVKQGDENGNLTPDSRTAMRLYYQLQQLGLKVFNSNESLLDKTGSEYEPYIMHALMTAKMLVVVASREEYINAPWVRNEWRRYRWLREYEGPASGRRLVVYSTCPDKLILPAELGEIQMINAQTDSAPMQRLCAAAASLKQGPKAAAASAADPQETAWLKRAQMYMSVGDFDQCDAFCEKVLDRNFESGMAYVYKLCAARRAKTLDDLAAQTQPLENDANYRFATEYCDKETVARLNRINDEILDRVRREREKTENMNRLEQMEREMRERLEREYREKAEQAAREANEKLERERAERAAAEKAATEAREKLERERVEREAAERAARERAEREAAERAAREKAEREAAQRKKEEESRQTSGRKTGSDLVGETLVVRVAGISDTNAQVELADGSRGFIYLNHCSVKDVKHPGDALKLNEMVSARVLSYAKDTGTYQLSVRRADRSPLIYARGMAEWAARSGDEPVKAVPESRSSSAEIGDIVTAKVKSMSATHAEVELENGQKGSIHVSHCAAVNVARPDQVLKHGDVVRAKVTSENRTTGKLILSIREAMTEAEKQAAQNAVQAEKNRTDELLSRNKVTQSMRHDPARAEELLKEGNEYSRKGSYKMAVTRLKMAAELGHDQAMFNLGQICENKYTGFYNVAEAFGWYLKGAQAGNVPAMESAARMYELGNGVQKNLAEAARWYKEAADSGREVAKKGYQRVKAAMPRETAAQAGETRFDQAVRNAQAGQEAMAASIYEQAMEKYAAGDHVVAAAALTMAAERGHADAAYQLSAMYYRGEGVAKDAEEGRKWLFKAAHMGNTDACFELACDYHFGASVPKNMEQAATWYLKAAELGHEDSMYYYGMRCYNGEGVSKDLAEAEKWFKKAADKGQKEAANMLERVRKERASNAQQPGDAEVLRMNERELRAAAEQGSVNAMYRLAQRYDLGGGVAKNPAEAVRWYTMAGDRGHTLSMNRVGVMHAHGDGCAKSLEKAVEWYRKSAEAGDIYGMGNLAKMLEQGIGTQKDLAGAVLWYEKAVSGGNDRVKEDYERAKKLAGSRTIANDDPEALFLEASRYMKQQDYARALPPLQRAAALGHREALYNLGLMYQEGSGVEKNIARAIDCYEQAGSKGFAGAWYNLGCIYDTGNGVGTDPGQARMYYMKAIDLGDAHAMNNLGTMYMFGRGVTKDTDAALVWYDRAAAAGDAKARDNAARLRSMKETQKAAPKEDADALYDQAVRHHNRNEYAQALELFRRAADQGHAGSINYIGTYYHNGTGVPRDYVKAREYYLKAAEKNNEYAMNNLAKLYENGYGVAKDLAEAFKLHKKAAERGHVDAMNSVGICYAKGEGVQANAQEAYNWYRKAADRGNMYAMNNVGWRYEHGEVVAKDLAEAAKWYKKAVDAGYKEAQASLDRVNKVLAAPAEDVEAIFNRGWDLYQKQDYDKALSLFRQAADMGHGTAAYNLGVSYERARGVKKDVPEAIRWYEKAAKLNIASAFYNMALLYYNGDGVQRDYSVAQTNFTKAAELGHANAMNYLGVIYEEGRGVSKDLSKASEWYKKAADNGNEFAPANLERVNKELQKPQKKGLFGGLFRK